MFVRSLRPAYYPILHYTAKPEADYVRCEIAFENHVKVRLDIDSVLFHTLDRAPDSPVSATALVEVSHN